MNLLLEEKEYPDTLTKDYFYEKFEKSFAFGHLADELYLSKKVVEVNKKY